MFEKFASLYQTTRRHTHKSACRSFWKYKVSLLLWFMKEGEGYDSSMDFSSRLMFQNDHERHSVVTVDERDTEIERCFCLFLSRARSVPPSLQSASRTRPATGPGHTSGRRLFRYTTAPPPSWPEPPACVCVICILQCAVFVVSDTEKCPRGSKK